MRKLALTLVLLLLVACGREAAAPGPVGAPAFNFMNGPATAGIYVVRFTNVNYITLYGPFEKTPDGSSWIVMVGLPPECGLTNVNPYSVQRIEQDARTNVVRLREGAEVSAWHWIEFVNTADTQGFCSAVALPRVATGTGTERSTDNDLFAQTSYNAWGWMMNGNLTFQGTTYHVQALERWQFVQPQGFRLLSSQYRIW